MEFFRLAFTRTNEHDSQELDIFSLKIQVASAPRCLADLAGGTASVSFGYPGQAVSYDIKAKAEPDPDAVTLELQSSPQHKLNLRLMPESELEVGGKISIAKSDYERSSGKITQWGWLSAAGKK